MPEETQTLHRQESSSALVARATAACEEVRRTALAYKLPVPPSSVCEELCVEVERAATTSARSMRALRAAVERFTTALRDDGASPEAVLIVLKRIVNSRTFPTRSSYDGDIAGEELRQQISTWSINEFFREYKA